jgi:hypothetical protein
MTIREGGMPAAVTGLAGGGGEIFSPCPCPANGLAMSSLTSTCFCAIRRDNKLGLSRAIISFSGNATGFWSCALLVSEKTPGAARRNSPNVILTVPSASWVKIFSNGSKTTILAVSVRLTRARNSIGSASRMGCNGSCNSPGLAGRLGGAKFVCAGCDGAGVGFICGFICGVCGRTAIGGMMGGGITKVLVVATGRGAGRLTASFSSTRFSNFRRNPANFDFTMVAMSLMSRLKLRQRDRVDLIGQEVCHKRLALQFQRTLIYSFAAQRGICLIIGLLRRCLSKLLLNNEKKN